MDLRTELKGSLLAGTLLVAPLAVTVLVLRIGYGYLTGVINPVAKAAGLARYTANVELAAQALAVVLILLGITLVGFIAQRSLGRRLFGGLDRAVGFIPLVSVIYTSVRQVADALGTQESRYEQVVLVEYPREGIYSVGFVTGDSPGAAERIAGEDVYNVFLPNSPNPTAGRLVLVPASRVHETDLPVRRGIRMLVTTGMADTEEELQQFTTEFPHGEPSESL
ncbi:DUF502 domain-containing protein [Natronomonas sp. EA1]|uniref:DUF502 domain-containing protein n=1 Tax=Natronomonas sp. EA1 TaxID=3421655 RepID=UPI003EBF8937